MGWLSALGKIGGLVAAPFTGGASLIPTIAGMAGDIGSVLGKQQQGKAQGQIQQGVLNQGYDRNAVDLYQAQQGAQNQSAQLDLQRKQFEGTNRGTTAKQALIGALLSGGLAPTSVKGGVGSGGLLQALQSNPDAIAAMKTLMQQGSAAQNAPVTFTGGELVKAPTLTPLPKVDQGGWLSTLAQIGQIAGAATPYLKNLGGK